MSALDSALDGLVGKWKGELLSILRIVSAYMFMLHGTQKMFSFPVEANREFVLASLNPGLIGVLEVFGGALLLIGLFTRPIAFLLSGSMAFAYWMAHAPRGSAIFPVTNGGDAAILYCFLFLFISAAGAGAWAVDNMMKKGG